MNASGQNLIKPCWTFFQQGLRSQKYYFPIFQHILQLLHHSHFHLQIKIFLGCDLANLPKDTPLI